MKIKITVLFFLITFLSYSQEKKIICRGIVDPNSKSINIDSEILESKKIKHKNNSSKIIGTIKIKSVVQGDTIIQNCASSTIIVKNIRDNKFTGICSDSKGEFDLKVIESEYDIEFQYVGFKKIKIQNFKIQNGKNYALSVILGQGNGMNSYEWKNDGFKLTTPK